MVKKSKRTLFKPFKTASGRVVKVGLKVQVVNLPDAPRYTVKTIDKDQKMVWIRHTEDLDFGMWASADTLY